MTKDKIELTEKEKAIVVAGIGLIIADAEKVSAAANRVGIQDAERAAGISNHGCLICRQSFYE